jgi:Mrp family chromosome partitioning ATPase
VCSEFNLIIIDGPALGHQGVAAIAAHADFIVLVVADDGAMTEVVRTAKAALSESRKTRLGVVINKIEPRPANQADQTDRVLPPQRSASFA